MVVTNKIRALKVWFLSLSKSFFLDLAGKDVILIAGSGRSGTSWLANICNYQNSFRYLFEPLNPFYQLPHHKEVQWCPSDNDDQPLVGLIFQGKVSNKWLNSRNKKFIANRRLIKEIRANQMLPWINKKYPYVKCVLLIRNPLSVAASRKKLAGAKKGRWIWKPSLAELLDEYSLKKKLSEKEYAALSAQVGTGVVMETIADWCINNLVVARDLDFTKTHVVFYEDLASENTSEIKKLMRFINVPLRDQQVRRALFTLSETTRIQDGDDRDRYRENTLNAWRAILDEEEIRLACQLLALFQVDDIYTKDWSPKNRCAQ